MSSRLAAPFKNAFQETLLGLTYSMQAGQTADLFSRACVEQFSEADWSSYGYLFTQVFEPDVLREVALLAGVDYAAAADLRSRPSAAMEQLADMLDHVGELPVVGQVNVASALISVSRFDAAARVLRRILPGKAGSRDAFEVGMLDFMISNRRDDGVGSREVFSRIRHTIETGSIPRDRILHACTQAVVWHLKRHEATEADFRWFAETGNTLAISDRSLSPASLSSWYRGIAMLPAAKGQAETTRTYMRRAQETAQETVAKRDRAFEQNLIKTYYESTLKEHLYLTGDFEKAEEAGLNLVELDSAWAPSYAELAEVYERWKHLEDAALWYEKAAAAGPPYMGHHPLKAARCREAVGQYVLALPHYQALATLSPANEAVLQAGLHTARAAGHAAARDFEEALNLIHVQ
ncbi:hypothetical protein ABZW30_34990 [Kitasatospora sp. NPDC004669]|uniref:hypothetical protein n=1 Tax=Kitasatospora sp. NPDC004669 TaxID=3154555 RepID=UPI0033BE08FB